MYLHTLDTSHKKDGLIPYILFISSNEELTIHNKKEPWMNSK